jgi:hypothetical protein
MVRYDWERFARIPASNGSEPGKKEDSDSAGNPSVVRLKSVCNPSDTHARTSSSTNRRVKQNIDVDIDVDNDEDKEKEKKEKAPISGDGYESRIHDIAQHYPFREGEKVHRRGGDAHCSYAG